MGAMAGMRPLLCVACAVTALAACSYDWTVNHADSGVDAAADVMTQPDVEVAEAGDAGLHDGTVADVVPDGPGPRDTGTPTVDGGSGCPELTQALLQARASAIACNAMDLMACVDTTTDECGCTVVMGGVPAHESTFEGAVTAFKQSGCSTTSPVSLCPATCPTVMTHLCLTDGGASYSCWQ